VTVKAVVFDYKALLRPENRLPQIRDMLWWIAEAGLDLCIFSTDPIDVVRISRQLDYPEFTAYVCKDDVVGRANRGSPLWVDAALAQMPYEHHELFYVGSTAMDWRTAINSGVFYAHAGWVGPQPPSTTSLCFGEPPDVPLLVSHFLMEEPRWSFWRDDSSRRFSLRCLLPAGAVLPATRPGSSFKLQDVFTYGRDVKVGSYGARDLLVLHAISSLYVEGLLTRNARFCVYPSSRRGRISEALEQYVRPAASLVQGYYKPDLLLRVEDAIDTSLARYRAKQTGREANISIATQAESVCVGERHRNKLAGKTVIVFDDFTTTGMSLEWARNLLLSTDVEKVVMLTIGKYGSAYDVYDLKSAGLSDPFAPTALSPGDYAAFRSQLNYDPGNEDRLQLLFEKAIREEP
jgi:hypothetical protein